MNIKSIALIIIALIIIAAAWFTSQHITFNYSITGRGIVYPYKEWTLSIATDGNITQNLTDNYTQRTQQYAVSEFQRGDAGTFTLDESFLRKDWINKGDTIGYINSWADYRRLTELKGELAVQQQLLLLYASGEKPEEVEVAHNRMILAEQEYETQQRINHRNEMLFKSGHIAEEEYEISQNKYQQALQNFLIAKGQHQMLLSGAKDEQLDYIRANITALQQNIRFLDEVISTYTITSPLQGQIIRRHGQDIELEAFIKIADKSSFIIRVPVEIYQLPHLSEGQSIEIFTPLSNTPLLAKIFNIENSVQMINHRQHIFVNALAESTAENSILPGMLVEVTINSEDVSMAEYIRRFINEVYNN